MNKIKRQNIIKKIIKENLIEDQQTLSVILKQNYNIDVNQSIISKDLNDLGISKHKINNKFIYEEKHIDAKSEILRLAIIDIKHNESTIIVNTIGGLAAFVGDYLDGNKDIGILATIAGENVVFVAPISTKKINEIYKKVCELLFIKIEIKK